MRNGTRSIGWGSRRGVRITKEVNWVAMPEAPLEPILDLLPESEGSPLLLENCLVLGAPSTLLASEQDEPQRDQTPADCAQTKYRLSEHQAAEPEERLDKSQKEQSWDESGHHYDPSAQSCATSKNRANLSCGATAPATTTAAAATTTAVRAARTCLECRWKATLLDVLRVFPVVGGIEFFRWHVSGVKVRANDCDISRLGDCLRRSQMRPDGYWDVNLGKSCDGKLGGTG